jgi:regulator of nonsense transcripts 2
LTVNILRALAPANPQQLAALSADQREKEESARLVRQRVFLRVTTELWLVNIIRSLSDASTIVDVKVSPAKGTTKPKSVDVDTSPLPLAVLKELLGKDKDHVNLPLLVAFTKNFSYDVLGVKQTNVKKPVDLTAEESKEGITPQAQSIDEPLCSPEIQEQFRVIVTKYFASVKAHIIRSHKVLSNTPYPMLRVAHPRTRSKEQGSLRSIRRSLCRQRSIFPNSRQNPRKTSPKRTSPRRCIIP